MNRKNITLALLSFSAAFLLAANLLIPNRATAEISVKERDYQVVTASIPTGGDGLYILDTSRGVVGVFSYDPSSRSIVPRAIRPIADAFVTR
jgi:hypothetical protein